MKRNANWYSEQHPSYTTGRDYDDRSVPYEGTFGDYDMEDYGEQKGYAERGERYDERTSRNLTRDAGQNKYRRTMGPGNFYADDEEMQYERRNSGRGNDPYNQRNYNLDIARYAGRRANTRGSEYGNYGASQRNWDDDDERNYSPRRGQQQSHPNYDWENEYEEFNSSPTSYNPRRQSNWDEERFSDYEEERNRPDYRGNQGRYGYSSNEPSNWNDENRYGSPYSQQGRSEYDEEDSPYGNWQTPGRYERENNNKGRRTSHNYQQEEYGTRGNRWRKDSSTINRKTHIRKNPYSDRGPRW